MPATAKSRQPLLNKRALLACSARTAGRLQAGLESMGAEVILFRAIEIREMDDKSHLQAALASLGEYACVIFTSSYSVLYFSRFMVEAGISQECRHRLTVCAVGPATAQTARECGFSIALMPEVYVAEGILRVLAGHFGSLQALAGRRILIPRAKEARDVLPDRLAAAGALVDVVSLYETVMANTDEGTLRDIREHRPDLMVFTSSSNVTNFVALVGRELATDLLLASTVAVIGPITAGTAESFGKKPDILPVENTGVSLLAAIRRHFSQHPGALRLPVRCSR